MPEHPNVLRAEGEPKPQEDKKETPQTPIMPKKGKEGPKKESAARASENVAKTIFHGRALGAILGIALLKGAVEYPIRAINYMIEKLDTLNEKAGKILPFGGIPLTLINAKEYLAVYNKIAGKYGDKPSKKNK